MKKLLNIIFLLCCVISVNRLLTSPSSVSIVSGCILLLSSILTLMAFWFMVTAVSILQNPTLVTMIRTTEICISLVTEAIYWSKFPDPLSAVGSFIVSIFHKQVSPLNPKKNILKSSSLISLGRLT